MRRRLRQQTRMREALLVDLGALVYELHRHGRREPELLQAKASELTVVDQEVRALADALGAGEGELALVAAGIAGSCEHCGTLLSTDARYCSGCGAEAAPSLPGSAPAAESPAQPNDRDLDPEATGVIGRAEPEPTSGSHPLSAEPESTHEPQAEPTPEPDDSGGDPQAPEREPDDSEAPEREPGPSERAPWLSPEDDGAPAGVEEPLPGDPPAESPPTTGRRRSGGAVGKVAGLIRRPRDGG